MSSKVMQSAGRLVWAAAFYALCGLPMSLAQAQDASCEVPVNSDGGGPYDYRMRRSPSLANYYGLVVGAHFTGSVRAGTAGNTAESPMPDLQYTLMRFPNHPEALMVVSKVQRKPGFTTRVPGRRDYHYKTTECLLEIARKFTPDDPAVWLVSAIHFQTLKKFEEALGFYQQALKLDSENPEIHYNLGLLHADQGQWPDAKQHAEQAYAKGYPLPGLRDRLKRANAW